MSNTARFTLGEDEYLKICKQEYYDAYVEYLTGPLQDGTKLLKKVFCIRDKLAEAVEKHSKSDEMVLAVIIDTIRTNAQREADFIINNR